jgi:hypothetical protein
MEIAVMAGLFAERDMDVDTGHAAKVSIDSIPELLVLYLKNFMKGLYTQLNNKVFLHNY